MNILDTIRYLVPNANVCVWECNRDQYQGESEPIEINGCLIDWQSTNNQSCPTLEELEACDPAVVATEMNARRETERKTGRDAEGKKNMALVQGYLSYKHSNPGAKFADYMDYLETASLDL